MFSTVNQFLFFMVKRDRNVRYGGISKLIRMKNGNYKWKKMEKVTQLPNDFDNIYKRLCLGGLMKSIRLTYNPTATSISGMMESNSEIAWQEYKIELAPIDGSKEFENLNMVHVELLPEFLVVMGEAGSIFSLPRDKFETGWMRKIEHKVVDIPVFTTRKWL